MSEVRKAWEADQGDPVMTEIWQTFGTAALKDKTFSGLSRGDPHLLREIKSFDGRDEAERNYEEICSAIAQDVDALHQDAISADFAVRGAERAGNKDVVSPLRVIENYFDFKHVGGQNVLTFSRLGRFPRITTQHKKNVI